MVGSVTSMTHSKMKIINGDRTAPKGSGCGHPAASLLAFLQGRTPDGTPHLSATRKVVLRAPMRGWLRYAAFAAFLPAALLANGAFAQDIVDEVRVGVYDHDTDLIGHKKERGTDFVLELVSKRIEALRFIGAPRFLVGGAVNSASQTNQVYFGLIQTWDLFREVMTPDDAIFLEGTLGGTLHDGKIDVLGTPDAQRWKSHGSRLLFRENIGIGYRFNAKWSVVLNLNHISNAGLADPNEGMNDIGLTVNMKLGGR